MAVLLSTSLPYYHLVNRHAAFAQAETETSRSMFQKGLG